MHEENQGTWGLVKHIGAKEDKRRKTIKLIRKPYHLLTGFQVLLQNIPKSHLRVIGMLSLQRDLHIKNPERVPKYCKNFNLSTDKKNRMLSEGREPF